MCVCVSFLLAVHSDPGAVILGGRRAHPSQTRGHRVHRQYPPVRTGEGVGTGDWEGIEDGRNESGGGEVKLWG